MRSTEKVSAIKAALVEIKNGGGNAWGVLTHRFPNATSGEKSACIIAAYRQAK